LKRLRLHPNQGFPISITKTYTYAVEYWMKEYTSHKAPARNDNSRVFRLLIPVCQNNARTKASGELRSGLKIGKAASSPGFTLLELVMVVAISAVLASVSISYFGGYLEKIRVMDVINEIHFIEKSIVTYERIRGRLPPSLADIGMDDLKDRWGNPYQYLRIQDSDDVKGGGGNQGKGNDDQEDDGVNEYREDNDKAGDQGKGKDDGKDDEKGGGQGNGNNAKEDDVIDEDQENEANSGSQGKGKQRRDRFMNPVNTDYDLYSMGPDGETSTQFTSRKGRDDIVRANNGGYYGIASEH
jgi:general secretion pathway protein G